MSARTLLYPTQSVFPSINSNSIQITKMSAAFAHKGIDVNVIGLAGSTPPHEKQFKLHLVNWPFNWLRYRAIVLYSDFMIWSLRPDVVYSRVTLMALKAANKRKTTIVELHSLPKPDSARARALRKLFYNPNLQRAYSHYLYAKQQNYEPHDLTFKEALISKTVVYRNFQRKRPYIADSSYGRSYENYLQYFSPSQFLFLKHEDVVKNPLQALNSIENFLGVSKFNSYNLSRTLASSGEVTNRFLYDIVRSRYVGAILYLICGFKRDPVLKSKIKSVFLKRSESSIDEWNFALDLFLEDIEKFESLSGLNLSAWKLFKSQ